MCQRWVCLPLTYASACSTIDRCTMLLQDLSFCAGSKAAKCAFQPHHRVCCSLSGKAPKARLTALPRPGARLQRRHLLGITNPECCAALAMRQHREAGSCAAAHKFQPADSAVSALQHSQTSDTCSCCPANVVKLEVHLEFVRCAFSVASERSSNRDTLMCWPQMRDCSGHLKLHAERLT